MKSISVTIVEDGDDVRESLRTLLESDPDFVCLQLHSDAESACRDIPGNPPDIVLLDINLPGMDGIACLRILKPLCPTTQFMMFTVFEDDDKVFEALAAGANGYLLKKSPRENILNALRELHGGGSPMSYQIARKVIETFQPHKTVAAESPDVLSAREHEVVDWLSKGYLYKEIGEKLSISIGTVKQHLHKIYTKLHVQNRTEAVNKVYWEKVKHD